MSPIVLGILVVVVIGALGAAFMPSFAGSGRADKRIKAMSGVGAGRRSGTTAPSRDARRRSVEEVVKDQAGVTKKKKSRIPLQLKLYQAGMQIKKGAFIRNSVILGAVAFVLLFVFGLAPLYAGVFALAIAYLLPNWYIGRRRKKYQKKFLEELPNAVEAIVRGVKTGLPLNDCIRLVAKEGKEPVRSEFARVIDAQSMGTSMEDAVGLIYERLPISEVNFFVVVISVQQKSGGNLSEALSNLARVLRDRKKMAAKVKAMSSEAKASALIIGSLPFIVAALVSVVTPNYLEPLFTTTPGYISLAVATIMMSMGAFIMNKMVQFDY
ncbi:MAG TPA: type II secretion system F family protein [Devosia sp.]|nr:type II secretion system F family protein [Devosia sp.]